MDESPNPSELAVLEALKNASKDLRNTPVFLKGNPQPAIKTVLEIGNKSVAFLSPTDPNLSKVSQLLCNLKSLLETLEKSQGFSLTSLLCRQITNYRVYHVAFAIEAELQAYIDGESIRNFVKIIQESVDEEEKVEVLRGLEKRLSQGFDRDFQELVLRAKVFPILESLVCDSACAKRTREHAALAIVALVEFNRNVFVGLVLMGQTVDALISMASSCSIQVLCSLIRLIRIPLIDELELAGEIPRIINLWRSDDLASQVAAMDCVCEIAYSGRKEVLEAMLEGGIIERLVELQRSKIGDNFMETNECNRNSNAAAIGKESDSRMESNEEGTDENSPFASCVARFAVQVEVGEGLSQSEKIEFKLEILRRVREASVSEAEEASIAAEVLWGSTP